MELTLLAVIAFLLGFIGWKDFNERKERSRLINAILARSPQEFKELETPPVPPPAPLLPPDAVALDEASQEVWEKAVLGDKDGRPD